MLDLRSVDLNLCHPLENTDSPIAITTVLNLHDENCEVIP